MIKKTLPTLLCLCAVGLLGFLPVTYSIIFDYIAHLLQFFMAAALVCALICLPIKQWRFAAVFGILTGIYTWQYMHPIANTAAATPNLSVLTYNQYLVNDQHQDMLNLIKAQTADIVFVTETTNTSAKHLQTLKDLYPYQFPRQNWYGKMILSKYPITYMYGEPVTGSKRMMLTAKILTPQGFITVIGLHAPSPKSPSLITERFMQMHDLKSIAHRLPHPMIVMGDFNATPWSGSLKLLQDSPLKLARTHTIMAGTWPAWLPAPFRIPIDHVYVSHNIDVISRTVVDNAGSDHMVVVVELKIPNM